MIVKQFEKIVTKRIVKLLYRDHNYYK